MYEGKTFAFIGLHKTKTSCFGMRLIHFTTLCNTLFQTKTSCFGHKMMITLCRNDDFYVIC